MESFEKMSGRHMSPRVSFATGALVGAIAVFVPFASSGHAGSRVEAVSQRVPAAAKPAAPAVDSNPRDAGKSDEPSNEPVCDVQLD
jgi:hypothetical protein